MPFGLKDIYATVGIRTTSHSKICENFVPTEDATAVAKFYQARAVLIEKLAKHEFAHGGPSFDLPWPPARIHGTAITSPVNHRAAPGLRSPPVLFQVRSVPIPAARSADPRRCAASLV